jgi:glycosyltransferase involved in cell wall biosynthesis
MSGFRRYDVCAAVIGDLAVDARVWREVRTLRDSGLSVALIGCAFEIEDVRHREEDGIDVVEIPLGSRSGRASPLDRVRTLLGVWRHVLTTRAHVFHVHNIHPGPAALVAATVRRAPIVYDAHELYGNAEPRTLLRVLLAIPSRLLEKLLVRRAAAVITTNRSRAEEIEARHGRADVIVLANVPDRVDELRALDPGYPPEARVLLYQGGIYATQRAFRQSVEALTRLDGFHLVIIGFGRQHDLELITKWAREFGVEDRVHLLGPRPFDELVHTAVGATVGLVPIVANNRSDLLGDTNKLHEYLMAGLPVVASDLPEIRRVVVEGEPPVGELFDPSSPQSIAEAVRRVVSDEEQYAARRRQAREQALSTHNWQAQEQKLERIYERLLGARP